MVTLHSGPIVLRPVRATPCFYAFATRLCQQKHLFSGCPCTAFARTGLVTTISHKWLEQSRWNLQGIFTRPSDPAWGRGTPFRLCCFLVHSLPHLLLFITFSLFPFLIHFSYFPLLSIRSLSTRIVPLRFQARGRRRWPNLGLVCLIYDCVICIA